MRSEGEKEILSWKYSEYIKTEVEKHYYKVISASICHFKKHGMEHNVLFFWTI